MDPEDPTQPADKRDSPAPEEPSAGTTPGRQAAPHEDFDPGDDDAGDEASESSAGDEDGGADDLPPPPDDGPLHVLPIRYLPLAEDHADPGKPAPAAPFRGAAEHGPGRRAWHWVPLGALVTLAIMVVVSFAVATLLPDALASLQRAGETVAGVADDGARVRALQELLDGPDGAALERALLATVVAFVISIVAAGAVIAYAGRTGALEAGLGTATFAMLWLLFLGGGVSLLGAPSVALAFGFGWVGGRFGRWLRRRREDRRASAAP